jgi:hypothetical protein
MKNEKGMKHTGQGQMANMPQEVKMKHYPMGSDGAREGLDDTIVGIDSQRHDSHKKMMRNPSKSMY